MMLSKMLKYPSSPLAHGFATLRAYLSRCTYQTFFFLCLIAVLSIFFVIPIMHLLYLAFIDTNGNWVGLYNFAYYFSDSAILESLKNTVFVSVCATFLGVSSSLLCAYAITRTHIKGKTLIYNTILLPLYVPSLMYGLGLIYLFGNKGIINALLGWNDVSIYGATGIIIAQSIYIFPQSFIILYLALKSTDYRLYEQAKIMGVSSLKTFIYITLPSIKLSIISATIVSFILCFTDFGTPIIIGGGYNVLSIEIYKQIVGQQNFSMGATVSMALLIPSIIACIILQYIEKSNKQNLSAKATPFQIDTNRMRDIILFILVMIPFSIIVIIMLAVLFTSIVKLYPYDLSLTLSHFSIKSNIDGLDTLFNSVYIALLTAFFGSIMTFVFGYLNKINRFFVLSNIANFLIIAPAALPGLVLGISYILFFNTPEFMIKEDLYLINVFYFLYGSFTIMIICNIVHFFSIPSLTIKESLQKIDSELELVGESMGISRWSMFFRVYLPLCLPAILENFIYYFLNAMVTISALIFIYTASNKVAAITVIHLDEKGSIEEAAALTIMLACISIVIKIIYGFVKQTIYKKTNIA